jgi:orotate phosphoribosyltransferase
VVIVDDVISDGAAKRAAIELIRAAGAEAAGVLLALDRQERGNGPRSAVQEMEAEYGVRCVSILTLSDLVSALSADGSGRARISAEQLTLLRAYRDRYGVT